MLEADQIFVSYAREDLALVRELYERLHEQGFNLWFDQKRLLPGQDWDAEISKAIRESRIFLALLSRRSVSTRGFVHRELREAQRIHEEHPEGAVYLIPVLLEPCEVPDSLRRLQWADLSLPDGFDQLVASLW